MPKVSVIMPCLNMEKYIKQCLDSVIHQTLKDIEIIIVDAGSTDGTIPILYEYVQSDSRIQLIHSVKRSYGYQMNLGISLATGEYIGIVETDDMIQPDMFDVLYTQIIGTSADYIKGTSEGFYQEINGVEWKFSIIPCQELNEKKYYIVNPSDTPMLFLYDNFLWNGIYRKGFIEKIKFNETPGAAFQDIGALFQILSRAKKGIYIDHLVYQYRQDNLNASSYNKKSFLYADAEYQKIKLLLSDLSIEWTISYYLKMGGLTVNRFEFMAASGVYWEESRSGIDNLREELIYAVKSGIINAGNCLYWLKLKMLLEDPRVLYEYLKNDMLKKQEQLITVLKIAKENNIYIFGAKEYGKFVHMFLAMNNANVLAYCDNNPEIRKQTVQKLKVLAPSEAVDKEPNAYFIITARTHISELVQQLSELGVMRERIIFYTAGIEQLLLRKVN